MTDTPRLPEPLRLVPVDYTYPALVAWAEEVMARAKAGEIWAGAWVVVDRNGCLSYSTVGVDEAPLPLIGALERLKLMVMDQMEER